MIMLRIPERKSLLWILWVGPKCNHMHPDERSREKFKADEEEAT